MHLAIREKYYIRLLTVISLIATLVGLIVLVNLPVVSQSKVLLLIGSGIGIILCCLLLNNVVSRSSTPRVVLYKAEQNNKSYKTNLIRMASGDGMLFAPGKSDRCAQCLCSFGSGEHAIAFGRDDGSALYFHQECKSFV